MSRRLQYTNLEFSENEKPASIKFNHWLSLCEKQRLLLGPYSISVLTGASYPNTATGIWLEITEDLFDIGGVYPSGARTYTNYKFDVTYATQQTISSAYVIWEKIQFYESGGRYITFLGSGSNVYPNTIYLGTGAGQINISGGQTHNFYCLKGSWS